jgi:hypothetical protein
MYIVFCYADSQQEWNTSQWRGLTPSDGINTHPAHQARMMPISDLMQYGHDNVQALVGEADVLVVQRNLLLKEIWEACDYWRGLGKTVVADLDDDYPHLTPQNPAYRFWILDAGKLKERTGYTPIEALTEGFRHVDGLISPNKLILSDWAKVLPDLRGYWVPNYANWEWHKNVKQKPLNEDEIIIGWGGSVSHWDSFWFSGVREALPVVFERYPQTRFKLCGGDLRLQRMLEDIIPGRWFHQSGVPPAEWPKQVASAGSRRRNTCYVACRGWPATAQYTRS